MQLQIAYISPRREMKAAGARWLIEEYLKRCQRYATVVLESHRSEAALFDSLDRRASRSAPHLIMLDSRGRALTSLQIADYLRQQRDTGTQELVLAIGPPDGWSRDTLERARLRLSLGAITLPHELALVVLAEQVYRGLTILAGHPYHGGHE